MAQSDQNVVALAGRLTRDAEAAGQNGDIAKLRLAFTSRQKDGDEWTEKPNYVDVVKFKATGILPYLVKGTQLLVTGRLSWREWEASDGTKRQALEIVAQELQLIGGKPEQAEAPKADAEPDWLND